MRYLPTASASEEIRKEHVCAKLGIGTNNWHRKSACNKGGNSRLVRALNDMVRSGDVDLNSERFSVVLVRNATAVREHLAHAVSQTATDLLTDIGNRLNLSHHIQTLLAINRPFGLLFLDLNRLQPFNDLHGKRVGDGVLRLPAGRMQEGVGSDGLSDRIGGDEFVGLLDSLTNLGALRLRGILIDQNSRQPFEMLAVTGAISRIIGSAFRPRYGDTDTDSLSLAVENMHANLDPWTPM